MANTYDPRTLITQSKFAAFGDSHTYGFGNTEQDTFAYKLGAVNYGTPGVSTDYVLRKVKQEIPNNNFSTAFFLWPDWTRFEVKQDNKYIQILPTDTENSHYYRDRDEDWLKQNRENKIVEIEQLCEKHGVLHVWLYQTDLTYIIDQADRWPIAESTRNNPTPHFNGLWHSWVADLFRVKMNFRQYEQTR